MSDRNMSGSIVSDRLGFPVDLETTAHEDAFAALHSKTLSSVSLLSPELLAYVMELAVARRAECDPNSWMSVALQDWFPDVPDIKQVIVLSHVCGFWRCVALDNAGLWTGLLLEVDLIQFSPNVDGFGLDSSLLERAQKRPLSICSRAQPRNSRRSDGTSTCLRNLAFTHKIDLESRIRHLWLTFGFPIIIPMNKLDAPLLESFYLFAGYEKRPLGLPKSAPMLRTLVLNELDLWGVQAKALIKWPVLSQLTRFAIGFATDVSQTTDDVVDILNMIERAPCLTDIAIRNVVRDSLLWQPWIPEKRSLRGKVALPLLERLTLIGNLFVVHAFLDHIQLPEPLELWLQPCVVEDLHYYNACYPDEFERSLQTRFVSAHCLSQQSRVPEKLVVTDTELECPAHLITSLVPPVNFVNIELFRSDGHRLLSLPSRGVCIDPRFTDYLRDIAAALPWDTLTETRLILGDTLSPGELLVHMLRARRLATLHASSCVIVGMAKMMREAEPTEWLPCLRTLVAVRVSLEDLTALLLAWKDINPLRPFETLILQDCQVNIAAVNTLLDQSDVSIVQVLETATMPGKLA